jgi:hypothetical protein
MHEARISFVNGRTHTIEANTMEMLKTKCMPFIEDDDVYVIWVCEVQSVGFFKSNFYAELDLEADLS